MNEALPNGAWEDIELVVYTSDYNDMEWDEADGIPTWCVDTGHGSVGLWARNGDTELPLVNIAPHGIINSFSTGHSSNTSSQPVSDGFIKMMAQPGEATQEQYDELPSSEQLIINLLREHIYRRDSPVSEVVAIVSWCADKRSGAHV